MKTRIIHTKIWEDPFFRGLSKPARYLFFYFITNYRINLCGIYELSDELIYFETGFGKKELEKLKKELFPKIQFFDNWVYVVNAKRLGGYKGKLCDQGIDKEMQQIPENIKNCFIEGLCDTPYKGYSYPLQGTRNNKQEIINNNKKQEAKKIKKKPEENYKYLEKLPEADIEYFIDAFEVSKMQLIKKANEMLDWIISKGKQQQYKDFKALLRNAVRKDFGEKDEDKRKRDAEIRKSLEMMQRKDPPKERVEIDPKQAQENKKKLDEIRGNMKRKFAVNK
jgi:hypothetical protein